MLDSSCTISDPPLRAPFSPTKKRAGYHDTRPLPLKSGTSAFCIFKVQIFKGYVFSSDSSYNNFVCERTAFLYLQVLEEESCLQLSKATVCQQKFVDHTTQFRVYCNVSLTSTYLKGSHFAGKKSGKVPQAKNRPEVRRGRHSSSKSLTLNSRSWVNDSAKPVPVSCSKSSLPLFSGKSHSERTLLWPTAETQPIILSIFAFHCRDPHIKH